jgi:predicted anti-sigma-YlaC factor YlaD
MNDTQQDHHIHRDPESETVQKEHRPYWRHAHHDWRFWAALTLMIAAMGIYVFSDNFAFLFRSRSQPPMSEPVGK